MPDETALLAVSSKCRKSEVDPVIFRSARAVRNRNMATLWVTARGLSRPSIGGTGNVRNVLILMKRRWITDHMFCDRFLIEALAAKQGTSAVHPQPTGFCEICGDELLSNAGADDSVAQRLATATFQATQLYSFWL